ncbi:MAG: GspE/PulE family protein [Patescibacteria group bacterium]
MAQFDDKLTDSRLAELHRKEEEQLVQTLAPQYGYEYINLRGYTINPEALGLISEDEARLAEMIPFELTRKNLSVAFKNPTNKNVAMLVERLQKDGYILRSFMCSQQSLEHGLARYHDRVETVAEKKGVLDINPDDIAAFMKQIKAREEVASLILGVRTANSARRISETIEIMFAGALALGASDIHIEPEEGAVRLRYRLDGVLQDIFDIERKVYERAISRLKLLSGMTLNQRKEAQDGRFTFDIGERDIEIRSSVIPGAAGESIVMRLLDPTIASFAMEQLGLNKTLHQVMEEQLKKPNGLIITTGPTGSGKTTALYAFLREVHTEERKIITIENPVEYKLEGIVQTQVGDDYTFATGLKAVLRQDPDVIMVGEIRDREVAETAIHASQTGHLVFSTLHTNSAVGAFPRLIDLGVDSRVMGGSINVVLGQRLVRLLCQHCRKQRTATTKESEIISRVLKDHPEQPTVKAPYMVYDPVGCEKCGGSGFKGRVGVYEAIVVDEAVEEAVIRDPREHIILEAARPQGVPNMAEHGITRVLDGETSLEELQRVVDLTMLKQTETPREDAQEMDTSFEDHIV